MTSDNNNKKQIHKDMVQILNVKYASINPYLTLEVFAVFRYLVTFVTFVCFVTPTRHD